MIPPFRRISLSEFRAQMPQHLEFVRHQGGHLWLMNHAREMAGVVPMHHVKMIERFETKTLEDVERENQRLYDRWMQVKGGG